MARAAAKKKRAEPERAPESAEEAARARAFWSGTLTFGLVSIPVDLYPANRSAGASLRTLGPEGTPLARRYYEPETGKEVAASEVRRGFEVEPGRHVTVTDEELAALAPEKSRDIALERFVPADQLDPLYFQRAYFLAPAGTSTRAYRLLAAVMEKTGRAGVATFVMRGKEYAVAILAERGILRAETLRFADEVRTPESIGLPERREPKPAAVRRMEKAVAALHAGRLDRDELRDEETRRLVELAEKKLAKGEDVVEVEPEESAAVEEIPDLMNVLQWSLRGAGERRRASAPRGRKKAPDGQSGKAGGGALEKRSKGELYERARELGIEGRSAMTKQELIAALRRAA